MPCAELDELISAYADGETVPAQTEVLQMHLETCARCTAVLRRHRETRRLLAFASDDAWTPPDLRLRVTQAYRLQSQSARRSRVVRPVAACVAVLVLLVGVLLGQAVLLQNATGRPAPHVAQTADCNACSITSPVRYAIMHGRKVPLSLVQEVTYDLAAQVPTSEPPPLQLPAGWPGTRNGAGGASAKGGEASRAHSLHPYGLQPLSL
jgi:anti-sigma factor RsiW